MRTVAQKYPAGEILGHRKSCANTKEWLLLSVEKGNLLNVSPCSVKSHNKCDRKGGEGHVLELNAQFFCFS